MSEFNKAQLILATQNEGKIKELKLALGDYYNLSPLPSEFDGLELPETGNTLQANAIQKASFIFERTGEAALADDTGLEVEALDMRPGVYSARYAGAEKSADANMNKLLSELQGIENRSAQFRTVIALVGKDGVRCFEGILKGTIMDERSGNGGFGYDPIFQPNGSQRSLAEYSADEKNRISHRGLAIQALVGSLSES